MLRMLPRFLEDFDIEIEIRCVLDLPADMHPEPELQARYGLADAKRLAALHQLNFPEDLITPSAEDSIKATGILVKHKNRTKFLHLVTEVTEALWGCSSTTFQSALKRYGTLSNAEVNQHSEQACTELLARGHYNSAMLYYGGEWYWGADRLAHLVDRLNHAAFRRRPQLADYQRQYRYITQGTNSLRPRPKTIKPLDFYFSFRSPYSYLAVARVYKLAELYKIPVIAKPVMPMVERGISLPKAKRRYILQDAKREADKYQLPFGKICDPLGIGVDNAMALFFYAQQLGKEKEFITSALTGIWADGLDMSRTSHIKIIVERANLSWQDAKPCLQQKAWERQVERHHTELKTYGLWGVPAFKYGPLILWGQDRLWALEQRVLAGTNNSS